MSVKATLVSHPGGTGMSLTPAALTNSTGVARAGLTLGTLPGNYRVSAVCQECEGNQEVVCNIDALARPNVLNDAPSVAPLPLKKSPINVTLQQYIIEPGGISLVYVKGPPDTALVPEIEATPNTGGHQHVEGRPLGSILPHTHSTDGNGDAVFSYTAGEVGGQERIIINAPDLPDYGDAVVLVSVPGLARLGPGVDYSLSGETPQHPSNHYGAEMLRQEISDLAQAFKSSTTLSGGGNLSVNDMSLINGGVFDVRKDPETNTHIPWVTPPHMCHKQGTSVDLDRGAFRLGKRLPIVNMANKIEALINQINTANPGQINCRRVRERSVNLRTGRVTCFVHLECPASAGCADGSPCDEE